MHEHRKTVGRGGSNFLTAGTLLVILGALFLAPVETRAEERKFIVMLGNSPKENGDTMAFPAGMTPGLVDHAYFDDADPTTLSFKEYWEEISYGSVEISGSVFDYVQLPWALAAPQDLLNENDPEFTNGTIPFIDLNNSRLFEYGNGERFDEFQQMIEVDWDGNFNFPNPDDTSDNPPPAPDPTEGDVVDPIEGFGDLIIQRFGLIDGVWTPGERFRDIDGDNRWDLGEVGTVGSDPILCLEPEGMLLWHWDPDFRVENGVPFDANFARFVQGEDGMAVLISCDADGDNNYDPGEPWEDFLVRYDPTRPEGFRWVRVSEAYIRNNYPGDTDKLVARMDNFTWDGPDKWTEFTDGQQNTLVPELTTKVQPNGRSVPAAFTPEPRWLAAMWMERYENLPPPWQQSVPEMLAFDPAAPDPQVDSDRTGVELERSFFASGFNVPNNGTNVDPTSDTGAIQPDATGVYDGPVEFDDMASSIYHNPPDTQFRPRFTNGDLRLGEDTSPRIPLEGGPQIDTLERINGEDLTANDPYNPTVAESAPDGIIWSAGPFAFRIHGDNLMDAGNQLNIELATWRTNGSGAASPILSQLPAQSFWKAPNDHVLAASNHDVYLGREEPFVDVDGSGGYSFAESCFDTFFPADAAPACFAQNFDGCFGIRGVAVHPTTGEVYIANVNSSTISVIGEITTPTGYPACLTTPLFLADATPVVNLTSRGLFNIQAITFDSAGTLYALDGDSLQPSYSGRLAVIDLNLQTINVIEISDRIFSRRFSGMAFDDAGNLWAVDGQQNNIGKIDLGAQSFPEEFQKQITGLDSQTKVEALSFGPEGNFWCIASRSGASALYKIVPATGVATKWAVLSGQNLYFDLALFDTFGASFVRAWAVNVHPGKGTLTTLRINKTAAFQTIFHEFVSDLQGSGFCAFFEDQDLDDDWDKLVEPWTDENGDCFHNFGGFRDFNLDGLIDQGETIVEGAGNYLNDYDKATPNDAVHSRYPFNRVRILEDLIEVNDHQQNFSNFVSGGQLPGVIYSVGLVVPTDNDFGDVREFSPQLININTRDQGDSPFTDANGNAEWDPGEPFWDVDGDGGGFDAGEPFNDFGADRTPGTGDPGEGNGVWDAGEPFFDANASGVREFGQPIQITTLVGPAGTNGVDPDGISPTFKSRTTAHEYGHFWEGWPDLYDIDSASQGLGRPGPIAEWDLMATGNMVHPNPLLKIQNGSGVQHEPWVDVIPLESVLTPGVPLQVTIASCETTKNNSYFSFTNPIRPLEQLFFWRVTPGLLLGNPPQPTTNSFLPGEGVLAAHMDTTICGAGLCQQQPSPWVYRLLQADGLTELQDGVPEPSGGFADAGDPFPGTTGNQTLGPDTLPNSRWDNGAISGIEILAIQQQPTVSRVTFLWTPQDVPWMSFITPPGGESGGGIYDIEFRASDLFGGTRIEFYMDGPYASTFTGPPTDFAIGGDGVPITGLCATVGADGLPTGAIPCVDGNGDSIPDPTRLRKTPGTFESTMPVRVSAPLENGDYFFFAKLIPGVGQDSQSEQAASIAYPAVGNTGNGTMTRPTVDLASSLVEDWKVRFNATENNWTVEGSRSGVRALKAQTGVLYTSDQGVVSFTISEGTTPFSDGDRFVFFTTGKSPFSAKIRVRNNQVSITPVARFTPSPGSGGAPLEVVFDASASFDPATGTNDSLYYSWDFGDGTTEEDTELDPGPRKIITHEYGSAGTFTAILNVTSTETDFPNFNSDNSAVISVTENLPPVACPQDDLGVPLDSVTGIAGDTGTTGFEIMVSADCSTDPNSDDMTASWDFGDPFDLVTTRTNVQDVPVDQVVSHTYRAAGNFTLTLTVKDSNGLPSVQTIPVSVTGNTGPLAAIGASPIGGQTPLAVQFNTTGTIDGQDPPASLTYDWDFGDGTPIMSGVGLQTISHVYQNEPSGASFTATVTVTDSLGVSAQASIEIFVGNEPPTAAISTDPASVNNISEDEVVEFDGTGSSDPNGDSLTFSWDFEASNGIQTDAIGSIVNHSYDTEGVHTVTLTVNDGKGGVDTETVVVTVTRNDQPIAVINASPTSGGPPLLVTFTSTGSSDRETPVGNLLYTWNFGDASGNIAGVGLTQLNHTYNIAGSYVATLALSDGVFTANAAVVINVAVPPPAAPIAVLSANVTSGPAPLNVLLDASSSSDADGDLATFLWEFGDGTIAKESLASVKHLAHTYAQEGTYTTRLTAFDSRGQSRTATIQIVVGPGGATAPTPAAPCGMGVAMTLSMTIVGLVGMKRRPRRRVRKAG